MKELAQAPALTDSFPLDSAHNLKARILRNGLTVSAFSMLETYLEDRFEENVADLPKSKLSYKDFSEDLRELLSQSALQGLLTRTGFEEKRNRLLFIEKHLATIGSFKTIPPVFSSLGFSPRGSNVVEGDLTSLLTAFGISGGWNKISAVCNAVGSTRLSLANDFRNFANARHRAAHDSTTNIASSDLLSHLETAILVGLSFDICTTHAIQSYLKHRTQVAAAAAADGLAVSVRFIDYGVKGIWQERLSTGSVVKNYTTLDNAKTEVAVRKKKAYNIVRDAKLFPLEVF